ncbi:MAG: 2-C-methyl-D-erythritol 2,4-cyclodiphosphate synthase [Planctomycetota bacterium]|nr:2-C-methyl-D-erythritol 2,4-cyclodiphosphate synthase [Planctomycetota bacterium]MDA1178832.1 2-C-methyl-D-erythritol 2,4-cyclodiphosphate synthase [Planctomycetota bacterium]
MSAHVYRIGLGHDTHRLADGGSLRLGGMDLPLERHLVGHSDADVLLHAITDAVLGGANLGDIGELFPDDRSENRGRDSADMLCLAMQRVREAGFELVNLDCVVLAQRPKILPFRDKMRVRIAEILHVDPGQIGIKAKTGEHVGPVGREEAIVAECVALLACRAGA